jgi:hypothetical protein
MPDFKGIRTLVGWCIIVTVFVYCWKSFDKKLQSLFYVPQATTSGQMFAGFNANFPGAIAMASAIVGVIAAFMTAGIDFLFNFQDNLTSLGSSPFIGMKGTFAWDFLSYYMPLDMLVSAVITVIVYRLFISTLATIAAGVLKFLVGP